MQSSSVRWIVYEGEKRAPEIGDIQGFHVAKGQCELFCGAWNFGSGLDRGILRQVRERHCKRKNIYCDFGGLWVSVCTGIEADARGRRKVLL